MKWSLVLPLIAVFDFLEVGESELLNSIDKYFLATNWRSIRVKIIKHINF